MLPMAWWIATGGIGLTLLLTRKARASTQSARAPSPPSPSWGEAQRVALAVPAGWRRVSSAEVSALPELVSRANALRSTSGFSATPYGTLAPFIASNGRTYATWVEQHYHEPGGPVRPWGYHHGVTLLARADGTLLDQGWRP